MKSTDKSRLFIVYQLVDQLLANPRNARKHSPRQIRQVARSIRRFGWTNAVIVDAKNRIIAGHARVAAAKLLGIKEVPTIRLDGLSEAELRAYMIADNKLAESAGWDPEILAIEFQELMLQDGLDIIDTGFEITEIDQILDKAKPALEEGVITEPDFDQEPVSESR